MSCAHRCELFFLRSQGFALDRARAFSRSEIDASVSTSSKGEFHAAILEGILGHLVPSVSTEHRIEGGKSEEVEAPAIPSDDVHWQKPIAVRLDLHANPDNCHLPRALGSARVRRVKLPRVREHGLLRKIEVQIDAHAGK